VQQLSRRKRTIEMRHTFSGILLSGGLEKFQLERDIERSLTLTLKVAFPSVVVAIGKILCCEVEIFFGIFE
jgi:hypothetical protein